MSMIKCDGITNLSSMCSHEYLEKLAIVGLEKSGVFYGGQEEEVIDIHDSPTLTPILPLFLSLRVLEISNSPNLKYLFGHGYKSNLPHLRKIKINSCEEMVGIIAAVTSPPPHLPHLREIKIDYCKKMVGIIAAVTSPPPHLLPFFPCLEKILTEGCHKMKRVVESGWIPHFPALRRIKVSGCEKMEEIIGGPPPYLPVEEISLESLDVNCCDNMRKLFPHEWLRHLRNLQRISVTHCKGMVEMISGARQGQEGSTMTPVNNTPSSFQPLISLPKLEYLLLYNLPQLKSICKVPISCDSMEDLRVCKCPELKGIPLQLRLCEIEELPYIWVKDEETWKTLMWDHPNAQAILQPYLRKGKDFNHPRFVGMQYTPNAIELFAQGEDLQ